MTDTSWFCPPEKLDRLAMLYVPSKGQAVPSPQIANSATRAPQFLAGGGGLISSAGDYQTFMTMLLRGGEFGGHRFVQRRTLKLMVTNNLPGGGDLRSVARDSFSETDQSGIGFGLGFSVAIDQIENRSLLSEGSFGWGGAASTAFWVDPKEELTVGFYTQLLPSNTYPIRRQLQQLVYSALVD
jgi:CubicO group peptidase (beta-lactamase class C family)